MPKKTNYIGIFLYNKEYNIILNYANMFNITFDEAWKRLVKNGLSNFQSIIAAKK